MSDRAIPIDGRSYQVDGRAVARRAIPDTVDERWPADEGSGTTLNNSITAVDISLTFDRWATGTQYNGDTAPDFANGDNATSGSQITGLNGTEAFVGLWLDNVTQSDDFAGILGTNDAGDEPTDGYFVYFESVSTELRAAHYDNGSRTDLLRNVAIPDANTNHLFVGYGVNGNNGELWVYDPSGTQQANATGTGARNVTGDEYLNLSTQFGDRDIIGPIDDIVSAATKPTTTQVEDIVNSTGPNA